MKLSVVIPCYNERKTVKALLQAVCKAPLPDEIKSLDIVLVDDASTDGTREILKELQNNNSDLLLPLGGSFRVYFQEVNLGKGGALRRGFAEAEGDIILVQDADLEYSPEDYPSLLSPIVRGYADVVFGSRFIGLERRVLYYHHYLANVFLTFLSNIFTNLNMTDMEACYKVMHRDVLKRLHFVSDRFGIEPEIVAKVAKLKVRVFEVGVRYHGRTYEEGKKITWKDGLAAFWHIFRFSLFP